MKNDLNSNAGHPQPIQIYKIKQIAELIITSRVGHMRFRGEAAAAAANSTIPDGTNENCLDIAPIPSHHIIFYTHSSGPKGEGPKRASALPLCALAPGQRQCS